MSFAATAWAVKQKAGGATMKLVLLMLADRANDEGFCWPAMATIASDCEISDRAVRSNIRRLEDSGLLRTEYRRDGDAQLSNVYHLNVGMVENTNKNDDLGGGRKQVPPPGSRFPPPRKEVPPNLSVEPITEPKTVATSVARSFFKRGYDPKLESNFCTRDGKEKRNDAIFALDVSKAILADVAKVAGKKIIAKPSGAQVLKLFKKGVTPQEVRNTLNYFTGENQERGEYAIVIESTASFVAKWDKLQLAMGRADRRSRAEEPNLDGYVL